MSLFRSVDLLIITRLLFVYSENLHSVPSRLLYWESLSPLRIQPRWKRTDFTLSSNNVSEGSPWIGVETPEGAQRQAVVVGRVWRQGRPVRALCDA